MKDQSRPAGLEPQIAALLEEMVAMREERAVERAVMDSDVREQEPAF